MEQAEHLSRPEAESRQGVVPAKLGPGGAMRPPPGIRPRGHGPAAFSGPVLYQLTRGSRPANSVGSGGPYQGTLGAFGGTLRKRRFAAMSPPTRRARILACGRARVPWDIPAMQPQFGSRRARL